MVGDTNPGAFRAGGMRLLPWSGSYFEEVHVPFPEHPELLDEMPEVAGLLGDALPKAAFTDGGDLIAFHELPGCLAVVEENDDPYHAGHRYETPRNLAVYPSHILFLDGDEEMTSSARTRRNSRSLSLRGELVCERVEGNAFNHDVLDTDPSDVEQVLSLIDGRGPLLVTETDRLIRIHSRGRIPRYQRLFDGGRAATTNAMGERPQLPSQPDGIGEKFAELVSERELPSDETELLSLLLSSIYVFVPRLHESPPRHWTTQEPRAYATPQAVSAILSEYARLYRRSTTPARDEATILGSCVSFLEEQVALSDLQQATSWLIAYDMAWKTACAGDEEPRAFDRALDEMRLRYPHLGSAGRRPSEADGTMTAKADQARDMAYKVNQAMGLINTLAQQGPDLARLRVNESGGRVRLERFEPRHEDSNSDINGSRQWMERWAPDMDSLRGSEGSLGAAVAFQLIDALVAPGEWRRCHDISCGCWFKPGRDNKTGRKQRSDTRFCCSEHANHARNALYASERRLVDDCVAEGMSDPDEIAAHVCDRLAREGYFALVEEGYDGFDSRGQTQDRVRDRAEKALGKIR